MMLDIAGGILLALLALFVLALVLAGIVDALNRPRRPVRYEPLSPPSPPPSLREHTLQRRTVVLGFLLLVGLCIVLSGRIPVWVQHLQ
jgi:hypothetical protein